MHRFKEAGGCEAEMMFVRPADFEQDLTLTLTLIMSLAPDGETSFNLHMSCIAPISRRGTIDRRSISTSVGFCDDMCFTTSLLEFYDSGDKPTSPGTVVPVSPAREAPQDRGLLRDWDPKLDTHSTV